MQMVIKIDNAIIKVE